MKYAPHFKGMKMDSDDARILETVVNQRKEALELFEAEEYNKVLEKTVESLKALRDFSDYSHVEFSRPWWCCCSTCRRYTTR